jgi:hypothetical protein
LQLGEPSAIGYTSACAHPRPRSSMVEQVTLNHLVGGSSPPGVTTSTRRGWSNWTIPSAFQELLDSNTDSDPSEVDIQFVVASARRGMLAARRAHRSVGVVPSDTVAVPLQGAA